MVTKFAHRASIILYNILKENPGNKAFLLPANVCPIVPAVFIKAQRPFIFVDIDHQTYSMNLDNVKELIRQKSSEIQGIVYVRNFGYIDHQVTNKLTELKSQKPDLIVIDDRCLTIPDFYPNSSADANLYSTGYAKFVELGYGGYALINSSLNYSENHLDFSTEEQNQVFDLFNFHLKKGNKLNENEKNWLIKSNWLGDTNFQQDFTLYEQKVKERLQEIKKHKELINEIYHNYLPNSIQLPIGFHNWRFNVYVNNKKEVLERIFAENFFASSHYSSVANLFKGEYFEMAEKHHSKIINLFNDFRISEEDAKAIARIVKKVAQ